MSIEMLTTIEALILGDIILGWVEDPRPSRYRDWIVGAFVTSAMYVKDDRHKQRTMKDVERFCLSVIKTDGAIYNAAGIGTYHKVRIMRLGE